MGGRWLTKIEVRLGEHAEDRWIERAGRPPGQLIDLIEVLLREHIRVGLQVHRNRALLPLKAEKFNLPINLIACIDLPDARGYWKVVTFKPEKVNLVKPEACKRAAYRIRW